MEPLNEAESDVSDEKRSEFVDALMKMDVLSVDSITKEDIIIIPKLLNALSHCDDLENRRRSSLFGNDSAQ